MAGQLRAWKSLLEMNQGFVGLGFAGFGSGLVRMANAQTAAA